MSAFYLLVALGLGAAVSMQPAINAQIATRLGGPLAAASCSIAISLAMVVAALMTVGRSEANWSRILTLPWWALVGGGAGALFVLGGIVVAPKVGFAAFFLCAVMGQVLGAALVDQFGAFGSAEHPINWYKALGIALVFAGVALTQAERWLAR